jgi:hypothetical protein
MKDAKAENQPDAGVHRYWPVLLVTKSRVEKLIWARISASEGSWKTST